MGNDGDETHQFEWVHATNTLEKQCENHLLLWSSCCFLHDAVLKHMKVVWKPHPGGNRTTICWGPRNAHDSNYPTSRWFDIKYRTKNWVTPGNTLAISYDIFDISIYIYITYNMHNIYNIDNILYNIYIYKYIYIYIEYLSIYIYIICIPSPQTDEPEFLNVSHFFHFPSISMSDPNGPGSPNGSPA